MSAEPSTSAPARGSFTRNSLVYATASMLQKASSLVLLPVYTRIMTPRSFGYLNLFTSFTTLAVVVALGGLEYSVVRYCSVEVSEESRARNFSAAFWMALACGIGLALLLGLTAPLYQEWAFPGLSSWPAVAALSAGVALQPPFFIYLAFLQARGEAVPYAIASVGSFLVNALLVVALVGGFEWGESGLATAYLASSAVFAGATFRAVVRRRILRWRPRGLPYRQMSRYAAPLLPHNLAQQATLFGCRMSVAQIVSVAALGLFNVATYMVSIVDAVQNAMHRAFLPWFFGEAAAGGGDLKRRVAQRVAVFVAVNALVSLAVALFADVMLGLLAHVEYWGASSVVPILAVSMMVKGLYYPNLSVLLRDPRGSRLVALVSVSSGLLGVGLSFALAPGLGLLGAALAQLAQRACMVLAATILARRLGGSMVPWRRVLPLQGLAVLLLAVGGLPQLAASGGAVLALAVKAGCLLAFVGGAALLEPTIRPTLRRVIRRHAI